VLKYKAIDLFCGAGGASAGLQKAGFDVIGIDNHPQPHYPFAFHQVDALEFPLEAYDLIWASPPCQLFTAYRRRGNMRPAVNLIPQTRKRLVESGALYIIENVPGAPLYSPTILCGTMFGLGVRRHRLFEHNFTVGLLPPCSHTGVQIPVYGHGPPQWFREKYAAGYPQATNRTNKRNTVEVGVRRIDIETQRIAMGIDWMNREELSQAIPPAYSEWLGRYAMKKLITGPD
jgi:DNA (cytosine-5)-methyltransferase 1